MIDMPDDVISVSAAGVLAQVQATLDDALQDLDNILGNIAESLSESDTREQRRPTPQQLTLQTAQLQLVALREKLQSASRASRTLKPMSREPSVSAVSTAETEQQLPLALNGLSATTQHRMAEIRSSLNLTDQQTLERCVATQSYIDDRLRDGWKFTISRGRERRAVSFPGQLAV